MDTRKSFESKKLHAHMVHRPERLLPDSHETAVQVANDPVPLQTLSVLAFKQLLPAETVVLQSTATALLQPVTQALALEQVSLSSVLSTLGVHTALVACMAAIDARWSLLVLGLAGWLTLLVGLGLLVSRHVRAKPLVPVHLGAADPLVAAQRIIRYINLLIWGAALMALCCVAAIRLLLTTLADVRHSSAANPASRFVVEYFQLVVALGCVYVVLVVAGILYFCRCLVVWILEHWIAARG